MVDMASLTSGLAGTANAAAGFIKWGFFASIVLVVIITILVYISYNWNVTLRYKTGTFDRIVYTRGKIVRTKTKITKFQSLQGGFFSMFKRKITAPVPPSDAISLTKGGKRCGDLEVTENDDTRWIIKKNTDCQFIPVDTDNREFYVNEMREAEERKKKTLSEVILALAPIAAVIIIFVLALVYWEDVMQPSVEFANSNRDVAQLQADTIQKQREIMLLQYKILGEEFPDEEQPPE